MSVRNSIFLSLAFLLSTSYFASPAWGFTKYLTVYTTDGTRADVQAAINDAAAVTGDTISLPAGNFTWSSGVTCNKSLIIIGAGKDVTTITLSGGIIGWLMGGTSAWRMSGMTITGSAGGLFGAIYLAGSSKAFRVDNMKFTVGTSNPIAVTGDVWGVIDHCDFVMNGSAQIIISMGAWPVPGGGSSTNGSGSWADYPYWGTEKFVFLEDNNFVGGSTQYTMDGDRGARYVFRHNTCSGLIGGHGTESGFYRGVRAVEVYNNFNDRTLGTSGINANPMHNRAGAVTVFNNVWKGYNGAPVTKTYRMNAISAPWGGADGTSPWDKNDATVYQSGAAPSASHTNVSPANTSTVTMPVAGSVTSNLYYSYTIRDTTATSPAQMVRFARIVSNTASASGTIDITYNTITGNDYYYQGLVVPSGNNLEIRRPLAVLDAPARGRGDVLTGSIEAGTVVNATMGNIPAWPRQDLEGIYNWGNRNTSVTGTTASYEFDAALVHEGGVYNEARPDYPWDAGVTAGAANPATRVGSDTLGKGDGTMVYLAGAGGYVYPHPLVSGEPPPPTPTPSPTPTPAPTPTPIPAPVVPARGIPSIPTGRVL